jgi:hypothetical protein
MEPVTKHAGVVPVTPELMQDARDLQAPCRACGRIPFWYGHDRGCRNAPKPEPERKARRSTIRWRKRTSWHEPQGTPTTILGRTNGELMARTRAFWEAGPNVLDVTYGRGRFWTHYRPDGLVGHDVRLDGVNYTMLPHEDGVADSVIFDPDYVCTGGRDTVGAKVLDFVDRYGLKHSASTPEGLRRMNVSGIREAHRVLRKGGRLAMKCVDYVSSGWLQTDHLHYADVMEGDLGMRPRAIIVHVAGMGPQPKTNLDGSPRRQIHPRRSHGFLLIYEKR